jgi:2-oxoisovalerate dehydrogenase E1 component alpha subunit
LGDPIERLRQHLELLGNWSTEQQRQLEQELKEQVASDWSESVRHGTLTDGPALSPLTMFDDVFKVVPAHLRRQREELAALRQSERRE